MCVVCEASEVDKCVYHQNQNNVKLLRHMTGAASTVGISSLATMCVCVCVLISISLSRYSFFSALSLCVVSLTFTNTS